MWVNVSDGGVGGDGGVRGLELKLLPVNIYPPSSSESLKLFTLIP